LTQTRCSNNTNDHQHPIAPMAFRPTIKL
jgi:hypothetical protein